MSGPSAPGALAPVGLLGVIRSWFFTRSGERWPSSEILPSETEWPGAHGLAAARVLVVDDNPVNLMLISALMASRGLVPLLAADGAEAVALASELHFDLILMDLQMPILDGWGATAEIRRIEASGSRPAVPVIAYSGTPQAVESLARHGFNGILAKPCGDQELEDCLVRWCPSCRTAPALRGAAPDNSKRWQHARPAAGSRSAWMR